MVSSRAVQLHKTANVVLGYVVMPQVMRHGKMECSFLSRNGWPLVDIPKMKKGGVDVVFWSPTTETNFYVSAEGFMEYSPRWGHSMLAVKRWLWAVDAALEFIECNSDSVGLALNARDIARLRKQGKIAVVLHLTSGGDIIDGDLNILRIYHRLGVRAIQLPHIAVPWITSDIDPPVKGGITDFGEQVIREMNRLGMVIDMAHGSDEATINVCRISKYPIVISHSCARALINRRRFVPDEVLKELAKNRGVIGVFFACHPDSSAGKNEIGHRVRANEQMMNFIKDEMEPLSRQYSDPFSMTEAQYAMYIDDHDELRPEKNPPCPVSSTTIGDVLDQIDYLVKVAGIDHVGIGSDYCGCGPVGPQGLEDASKLPALTQGLLDRGYSDKAVLKIMGGNFLRVFGEVTA